MTALSDKVRAGIKASKGKLSQAAAARKFGVSRRTVGRIFNDGELSQAKASSSEVEALREQVAKLTEMVEILSKRGDAGAVQQRVRPALNPKIFDKRHKHWWFENRSPYYGMPGPLKTHIYGTNREHPTYFGWQLRVQEEWFLLNHPASPECTEYPYPKPVDPKAKPRYSVQKQVEYKDPPAGKACLCKECKLWRRGMAYEHDLVRLMPFSMIDVGLDEPGCPLGND